MSVTQQSWHSTKTPCNAPEPQAGGGREVGRGHGQGRWPKATRGILHTMWCHTQPQKLGKRKEKGSFYCENVCPPKSPPCVLRPCFPGRGQASLMDGKQKIKVFFFPFCFLMAFVCFFACSLIDLSLSQPSRLFLSIIPSSSPFLLRRGVRERLWWCSAVRIKPPQVFTDLI